MPCLTSEPLAPLMTPAKVVLVESPVVRVLPWEFISPGATAGQGTDGFAGAELERGTGDVRDGDSSGVGDGAAAGKFERARANVGGPGVGVGGGEDQRAGAFFENAVGGRAISIGDDPLEFR